MGAQDKIEEVLRDIHMMVSEGEEHSDDPSLVIINKQKMVDLLTEMNKALYEVMEEYELTQQSRNQAEREFRKHTDEIVQDASQKAEDVYAASVMYTDGALNSVRDIMKEATASIAEIYAEMDEKLKKQEEMVRQNQKELTSQLQNLSDTDKYLKLIEEWNRQKEKEKAKKEGRKTVRNDTSRYEDRRTEIRVNQELLENMGMSTQEDREAYEEKINTIAKEGPKINVNLDSEYFQWKENENKEQTPEKHQANSKRKKFKNFNVNKKGSSQ